MKKLLFLTVLLGTVNSLSAQYVYTIKADSVKITNNCDTAELILENHTQNVLGFLYNKGKGRTEFRKAVKLNDSTIISSEALATEISATIAPSLILMAKQKKKLQGETELERAQEQLEGIENAQETLKQNKPQGQKKQSAINSIKKSKQRVKNALKQIKNAQDAAGQE